MSSASCERRWWTLVIDTPEPGESGALLIEKGASGIEEIDSRTVRAFFEGDETSLALYQTVVPACGGKLITVEAVEIRNWVQESEAQWAPLRIGELHVIPVLDSGERATAETSHPLYINPGTGFGTGHHPTTHMVLELLQSVEIQKLPRHSPALDLGTGSGILALGAAELYGCEVDAIEIDPLALENAAKNVALNPRVGNRLHLIEGDLTRAHGPYPLMLANIYAEVLCELAPGLTRLATPETKLVVSGIMAHLKDSVLTAYRGWRTVTVREDRGWVAILFSR